MDAGLIGLGAGLGAGLAVMGGGAGIGRLTAAAVESIARQPEAAGDIRGSMIIMAAFIEGVTMFAILLPQCGQPGGIAAGRRGHKDCGIGGCGRRLIVLIQVGRWPVAIARPPTLHADSPCGQHA